MKKYYICMSEASDLIPEVEHIERNDVLCEDLNICDDYDDFDAALEAQEDGIKLIGDIEGIYNNFYVDTHQNRKIINEYLKNHTYILDKQGIYSYKFKGY